MKKILILIPLSILMIFEGFAQRTPNGVTKQALTDSVAKRPALSTTGKFYPAYDGSVYRTPSIEESTDSKATLTTKIQSGLVPTGALTDSVVMYNPITKAYSKYLASDLAGTSVTSTGFVNLANQVFATNVYANSTNGTFAIPSAGKWLLKYNIQTDGTGVTVANPMFAITDAAGTVIVGSERARAGASTVGQGLSAEVEVTTTGAENYFLKGRAGAASGSATILSSSTAGQSTINWIQVGTTAVSSFANLVANDANGNTVQVDITKSVGIGTATPTTKLDVNGEIKGTRLIASGAGAIASNTAVGGSSLIANTTGTNNTAVGFQALFGATTATNSVAIGGNALQAITTGNNNVAIGSQALRTNTIGSSNIAVGGFALVTGTGSSNIAIGHNSALAATSAIQNVTIGGNALANNTTGANNTIIGHNTGAGIVTGGSNTIIGANVTGLASGLSGNIVLADGNGNQRINVDGTGKVGIGQTVPTATLHVNGTFTTQAPTAAANQVANFTISTAQVDVASVIVFNQTTAGILLTAIGSPTSTTTGRFLRIHNIGTASFSYLGDSINPSTFLDLQWNGTVWAKQTSNSSSLPSVNGGLLFGNGTTQVQDATNLFYDDTNNRLGIGTTTPTSKLHVEGSEANTITTLTAAATLGEHRYVWASGPVTYLVTLPAASTCTGRIYTITNTQIAKTISSYTTLANVASTTLALNTTLTLVSTGAVWKQF